MADELAQPRRRARRGGPARRPGADRGGPARDAARRRGREARAPPRRRPTSAGTTVEPSVAADLNTQLVLLTKRAALMESQVDVLEGKRRALGRYRDALAAYRRGARPRSATSRSRSARPRPRPKVVADPSGVPPAVSRLLLGAQEDLRREIARAMHDGPAQSLTNIVLQAQIVERLVATDPGRCRQRGPPARGDGPADARGDQVVHLRRPPDGPRRPRAWCRRSGAPRASAAGGPASPSSSTRWARTGGCRWTSRAACSGSSTRRWPPTSAPGPTGSRSGSTGPSRSRRASRRRGRRPRRAPDPTPDESHGAADLPPALAAMMADRRADARDAVEAAKRDAIVVLPPSTWREIQSRAATLGMVAELSADGAELRLVAEMPAGAGPAVQGLGVSGRRASERPGPGRVRADPGPDERRSPRSSSASSAGPWRTSSASSGTPSTRRPAAERRRGSRVVPPYHRPSVFPRGRSVYWRSPSFEGEIIQEARNGAHQRPVSQVPRRP